MPKRKYKDGIAEVIQRKKVFNMPMRVLSYFINTKEVKTADLLNEIFGNRIFTNKFELFSQKLFLSSILYQIKQNYGIYFKSIHARVPVVRLITEKEDFDWLHERIEKRIENLEVEKSNVEDVLNDLNKYNSHVASVLEAIKDKLVK